MNWAKVSLCDEDLVNLDATVEQLFRSGDYELALKIGALTMRLRGDYGASVEQFSVRVPETGPFYVIEGGGAA